MHSRMHLFVHAFVDSCRYSSELLRCWKTACTPSYQVIMYSDSSNFQDSVLFALASETSHFEKIQVSCATSADFVMLPLYPD